MAIQINTKYMSHPIYFYYHHYTNWPITSPGCHCLPMSPSPYRLHNEQLVIMWMIKHWHPAALTSHLLFFHISMPLVMCQDIYNCNNIPPDTRIIHTHLFTVARRHKHTKKHCVTGHISSLPVSILGLNVPPITTDYRSHRWWIAKRLTPKYQSRLPAYWMRRSSVPAPGIDFQKATLLIHEGNMVAYIRAIWAN